MKKSRRLKKLPGERRVRLPRPWRLLKRTALAIGVLLVAVALIAAALVMFTGVTDIRDVKFSGNKYVPLDYLQQASGIANYKNLITLPVSRIATSLMKNPWVSKVRVKRKLLHDVDIAITERVPVAMIETAGTGYLVDATGMVMAGCPEDQLKEMPRIFGGEAGPPVIGEKVSDRKISECVKILGTMPASMRSLLAMANPFDGRGPVFICTLGFNVVYGNARDARRKNEVMEAIVTDVKNNRRKIEYIDIRVPDSPVIRPI